MQCDITLSSKIGTLLLIARTEVKKEKKARLKKKFIRLQKNRLETLTDPRHSSPPPDGHLSVKNQPEYSSPLPPDERVSVLDNIEVPTAALQALAKGPKFVITPKMSRETLQHSIQVEVAALAYALRWGAAQPPSAQVSNDHITIPNLNQLCPFHSKRKEPPRDNIDVEKKIQMLQTDLQRLVTHCELNIKTNLTRKERDAIRDLCLKDDTVITRSDKGGEVVVMETSHLKRLCEEHLADALT